MKSKILFETTREIEKAFLVGISITSSNEYMSIDDSLKELTLLSETAGLAIVGFESQILSKPNPATFIGSGKVNEIKLLAENLKANLVVFDTELSPRNFRELEKSFGENIRVIDRTTLILDIFGQHAQTREGKLQVELAQYEYLLPRLTKAWSHLARQAGGSGGRTGITGGVGLRGPGETQLEVDRRRIKTKIRHLKEAVDKVRSHRKLHRKNRKLSQLPIVTLVGYTNAGKSTILNQLTNADVLTANKLFATLDPTTRRLSLPSGNIVLLTDTVGFIQKLPTHLIAAFRATLEEISEADLLLHVIDIDHTNTIAQYHSVMNTLIDIGAGNIPLLTVLNKVDKANNYKEIKERYPEFEKGILISALKMTGIDRLLSEIDQLLFERYTKITAKIPYKKGKLISLFHQFGKVEKVEHGIGSVLISGSIPGRMIADFERYQLSKNDLK
ncbi:MAG: GTPase HflX [Clostridiales bacterium]|nr:GTPase HflX [Clostridiales bacterium]